MGGLETLHRVLVVERAALFIDLYRSALELGGFSVEWAAGGSQVFQKIEAFRPSVIVLDNADPSLEGWELLDRLQEMSGARPVVVISASTDRDRAAQRGARACLSRPFPLAQLRETCADLCRARAGARSGTWP